MAFNGMIAFWFLTKTSWLIKLSVINIQLVECRKTCLAGKLLGFFLVVFFICPYVLLKWMQGEK